jgi:hypothetical protein
MSPSYLPPISNTPPVVGLGPERLRGQHKPAKLQAKLQNLGLERPTKSLDSEIVEAHALTQQIQDVTIRLSVNIMA